MKQGSIKGKGDGVISSRAELAYATLPLLVAIAFCNEVETGEELNEASQHLERATSG